MSTSGESPASFLWKVALAVVAGAWGAPSQSQPGDGPGRTAQRVEIVRTGYGVPHILAQDEEALGLGIAWVQLEDYGDRVLRGLVSARGDAAISFGGRRSVQGDADAKLRHRRAEETFDLLDEDVRAVLEGFAAGANLFVETHGDELPDWVGMALAASSRFTGVDVHALNIGSVNVRGEEQRLRRGGFLDGMPEPLPEEPAVREDIDGSNMWALAPSRTESGHAILMRNPHLAWSAGYYEAHLVVPGRLDFYGDIRIGGPFAMIAGFNRELGWSTTNNAPDYEETYELQVDPENPDHYLFDGESVPLVREVVRVPYLEDGERGVETVERWFSPLGPVAGRSDERVYVVKSPQFGEYRLGQQFLRMMRAESLQEWQAAVAMRAKPSSNLCYADREGNIFWVWNASLPDYPHEPGRQPVPASGSADVWQELVPFDRLPQLLNPEGGYLHNENDPPHFTNLHAILDPASLPRGVPNPRLRLRSQHSLALLHNQETFSLEEVGERKHSMRLLLAERVKADLLAALEAAGDREELGAATELLAQWDNGGGADSRAAVLFEIWWQRYRRQDGGFAADWSFDEPVTTPRGLADPELAVASLQWAVSEVERRHGRIDVPWGEVHRVRRGGVDEPVGGGSAELGHFRVLSFAEDDDGLLVANRGDGWVFAVEFGEVPRAYSVLAYGQSNDPGSPHFSDQAALFAQNRMKPVAFTEEQIRSQQVRSYHPGDR